MSREHPANSEEWSVAECLRILRRRLRIDGENALSQSRLSLLENFQILFEIDGSGSSIRRF